MGASDKATADIEVNADIKVPRYMQVYSTLQQWIAQGHYPPGGKLEPESRLCEMFGVSRITIRKALELLIREGLVDSIQGKGSFVSSKLVDYAMRGDMSQRIERARYMARNSRVKAFNMKVEAAAPEVAQDLKLENKAEVQHVSYIRVLRGINIGLIESWHSTDLKLGLNKQDFTENTMFTILPAKGISLSGIDHLIGATLADTRLATALDINVGAPVIRIKLVMLNKQHQPVQRVLAYFRADKYEHHMFLARDGQEKQ